MLDRGHNSWLFSCKILWTEEACFTRNNVWLWYQYDGKFPTVFDPTCPER